MLDQRSPRISSFDDLLAQVRCAVINGDLAEKLKAYKAANVEAISPEVSRFLDALQRAAA
jgi:hypothetical protein